MFCTASCNLSGIWVDVGIEEEVQAGNEGSNGDPPAAEIHEVADSQAAIHATSQGDHDGDESVRPRTSQVRFNYVDPVTMSIQTQNGIGKFVLIFPLPSLAVSQFSAGNLRFKMQNELWTSF